NGSFFHPRPSESAPRLASAAHPIAGVIGAERHSYLVTGIRQRPNQSFLKIKSRPSQSQETRLGATVRAPERFRSPPQTRKLVGASEFSSGSFLTRNAF